MKKIILKTAALFIFTVSFLISKAQNSLDLRWGHFMPVSSKVNSAFANSNAFSIGLLHPLNHSDFSVGLTLSHQEFRSKDDFFEDGYIAKFHIHNYLITTRYDFINNTMIRLYAAADAGLNKSKSDESKAGIKKELKNTGITTGISLGADLRISRRIMLGANLQNQFSYINSMQFDDKISINNSTTVAANIGVRFLLGIKSGN